MEQLFLKPLIKPVKLVWSIPGQRRIDIHDQAAVRHEPEVLVFKVAQALRDQTSCNQEHNREYNLCDDQRFLQRRRAIPRGTT